MEIPGMAWSAEGMRLKKRLDVAIAIKDAERGRPLTAAEKLANLARALSEETPDEQQ